MTRSTVGPRSPKNEPPHGWGVLLALLAAWGITLRLGLLLGLLLAAVVAIVAVIAIYLGAVGVGALFTLGGSGAGAKWFFARRRRHPSPLG
jgi:hypothetical protein